MFSDPEKIVDQCSIQPGMEIADFGAGSGAFSIAAARHLMSTGRVYAIDIQKDLLTKLKNSASKNGVYNVEVIWGDIDKENGTKLRASSVDLIFLNNILFQLEDKNVCINEIKRILKPTGKVCVVDWSDSFGGIGPQPQFVITKASAISLFEKAGFHKEKELLAGSHHYGLIFKKL